MGYQTCLKKTLGYNMSDINNTILLMFESDDEEDKPSKLHKFISKYSMPLAALGGGLAVAGANSHIAQFATHGLQSKYHYMRANSLATRNPEASEAHMIKSVAHGLQSASNGMQSPTVVKLGIQYAKSKM